MRGLKHLVQCHCILPQYKNAKDPVFHKFTVFSVIDESDTVITKFADCNNCGSVHKVYDLCKSEIMPGKEDTKTALTKSDFKFSMPSSLYELLGQYEKELCDYEYSQFVIDNKVWDSTLILTREEMEDQIQGKILRFLKEEKFRIESYSHKVGI